MSNQAQGNPFFTPTQISGCSLWLDAADRSSLTFSSGTNVSTWADKSGGGYNVTQGTSTRQPTYNATNRQLLFTGDGVQNSSANQALQNTSIPVAGTAYTIFSVAKGNASQPSFTGYNYMIAPAVTFPQARLAFASLSGNFATFTGTGTTFNDTNANTPNISVRTTTRIWCMVVSGSTLTPFYDGISMNTKVGTTGSFTGLVVGDAFSTDSGQCWNGSMNEILFYNSALSTNERQQVEGYLAWKWGLQASLPANHPYKSSPIPPLLNPPTTLPTFNQNTSIVSWSPFQIPGCTIWLDASDRTTLSLTGTTVNNWSSKVSSLPLLASSVGGGSIVYSNYSNLPSLYFNGSSTRMTTGTIPSYGATGTTWLTASVNLTPVVENSTPVDASVVFATLSGSTPEKSIRYNFPPQFIIYTFNNGQIRGGRSNNDNGIRGFIDSGPSMYAFVNGVDITVSQLSATYQPGVNQAFQLGQWNTGWLLGHIQEVLVYNSALSISQYQLAEGYLAWKWGFQSSLPRNHPYKNNPPLGNTLAPLARSIANNTVWQPNQISGLAVWLDSYRVNGTTMPGNNTQVSSWVNLANQSANFTQATSSRQPTFLTNSVNTKYPSLYFNSSNTAASIQYLYNGTNIQNTSDASFFFVSQYINVGGDQTQIDQRKATNGTPMRCFKANQNQIRDPAGNLYTMNLTAPVNTLVMRSYRDTLNTSLGYLNGTQVTSSSGTYNQQAADNYGILIGCHFDSFNNNTIAGLTFAKVYISEVLIYNSFLSLSDQQRVEGYLAWKWGLQGSLPANHPFKRWPPSP